MSIGLGLGIGLTKAASGASDGHSGSELMLENETDAILLEGDATDGNDTLLLEA